MRPSSLRRAIFVGRDLMISNPPAAFSYAGWIKFLATIRAGAWGRNSWLRFQTRYLHSPSSSKSILSLSFPSRFWDILKLTTSKMSEMQDLYIFKSNVENVARAAYATNYFLLLPVWNSGSFQALSMLGFGFFVKRAFLTLTCKKPRCSPTIARDFSPL